MALGTLFEAPPDPQTQLWLSRVAAVADLVAEHRQDAERARSMPRPVFEALADAGLTRMWISAELGGGQAGIRAGCAAISALARIDASAAWQIGVQGAIGRLSDYLPEPTARKLFADHRGLVVGGINPAGRAVAVPGGYRVSGEWGFASGSAHADWMVSTAILHDAAGPVLTTRGTPAVRMVFVPRAQIQMLDTWHTLGLRATGSNHYRLTDVFVPDDHTVDQATLLACPPPRASRGYAVSYYDFAPFTSASTVIGIGRDALDSFKELATRKVPARGRSSLADSHTVQDRLARAQMQVHSCQVLLNDAADRVSEAGEHGGPALSALIRLTTGTVGEQVAAAVSTLCTLAGTSSLYTSSRLERCFRDVNSAVRHIMLAPSNIEMVGQYLLGGELQVRR